MAKMMPSKFRTNPAARKTFKLAITSRNIQKTSSSPETRTSIPRTIPSKSRKNASPNRMLPRRRISVRTISLRKIIRRAAPVARARILAVETIAAMTVATIADRIPAATVAVVVSAVAVDAVAEAVLADQEALATCLRRNMPRRKALKATIPVAIRVAMNRVRKARIVARNLADSSRAGQRSGDLIIAALKHHARAPRQRRTLMPLKNRSFSRVNRSRNTAASPSRRPLHR